MRKGLLIITLLVLAGLSPIVGADGVHAQDDLSVEGQIVRGAPDGAPVQGVTVVLHRLEGPEHRDRQVITDATGRFRFQGLASDPSVTYAISVRYEGALYGRDLDLSNGSLAGVTLAVYGATSDQGVLSIPDSALLITGADKGSEAIEVLEMVTVENTSERTYVPDPEQPMKLVRFGLPRGYTSLRVDTRLLGADVLPVDRGFAITASVPPGKYEVLFSYWLPYSGPTLTLSKSLPYGAGAFSVLAPVGLEISSGQLGAPTSQTIGGRQYRLHAASGLEPGADLTLEVSGLPQASPWERSTRWLRQLPLQYAPPLGLGVLALAVLGWALLRARRTLQPAYSLAGAESPPAADGFLQALADLDSRFERGELNAERYGEARSRLQAKLVEVLRERRTDEQEAVALAGHGGSPPEVRNGDGQ